MKKIESFFTLGKKQRANKLVRRLVNEKSRGAMDSTVSKRAIKKIKPTCFTNDYKRAWFINYSDEILILGHLSNENHNSL